MNDQNVSASGFERFRLIGYALKIMHKITPTFLPSVILRALFVALQPLLVLFFSSRILNELDGARNLENIILYVALTVGLSFLISVIRGFVTREVETYTAWERIFMRLQLMQAEQFISMDYSYAEDTKISESLARMDTLAKGNGLGLLNMYFLSVELLQSIFSLIFAWLLIYVFTDGIAISGVQSGILYAVLFIGLFLFTRYTAKQKRILDEITATNARANTMAGFYVRYVHADQAAKDIKLYKQKDALAKIFEDSFSFNTWIRFFFFNGRMSGFSMALLAVFGGAVFLLTGSSALYEPIPMGDIILGAGAVTAMATAIGTIVALAGRFWNNAAYLKPLKEFLSLPDVLAKGSKPVPPPNGHDYHIEFRNVSFKYPGAEDYAVKNLNIEFTPGERFAVVGRNGSGKSTMIKLLCRLYDPTEGEIFLDGVNIKEYDYASYIRLFSVVFQDYLLFPLWLGQNVAVGEHYDLDEVLDCLDGAGFSERLESMPEGLDTVLYKSFDENGTEVSGGEAQKIALARALYRKAPLVVLDEPTAALDPIAEYEVYTTFDHTIGDKTAVFISHRLSSCRFCNRIAVFDEGELVQLGTHEELLENDNGLYYDLWEAQAGHYRD